MKQSFRIWLVLVLLTLCSHRSVSSDIALKKTGNHPVIELEAGHLNDNFPSSDNQSCAPTPDYLGEFQPVGPTTTASPEETPAFGSAASTLTTTTSNCTLCNPSGDSALTEVSTEMRRLRGEVMKIHETVDTFYAFLGDLNRTLHSILGSFQDTGKRGKTSLKHHHLDESFSIMDGPTEGMANGCPTMFRRFYGRNKDGKNDKGTCLWFSNITGSWAEALVYCKAMGSHLAMLSNWVLHTNVSNYMRHHVNARFYYLGGTDYQQEGVWRWLKPKKFFPHRLWKEGQPDNKNNAEHCLAIGRYTQRYKWSDVQCDRRLHFICQRKAITDG